MVPVVGDSLRGIVNVVLLPNCNPYVGVVPYWMVAFVQSLWSYHWMVVVVVLGMVLMVSSLGAALFAMNKFCNLFGGTVMIDGLGSW